MRTPYTLPDADCERLRRNEMNAVRMLLALLSTMSYAKDDLRDRLECVPNGNRRFRMASRLHHKAKRLIRSLLPC